MVQATLHVYKETMNGFLPTPAKSHYVFNLRDFARVIRGVLLVPHTVMSENEKLIRLWIHEIYRVFYDRLTDDADRYKCTNQLSNQPTNQPTNQSIHQTKSLNQIKNQS